MLHWGWFVLLLQTLGLGLGLDTNGLINITAQLRVQCNCACPQSNKQILLANAVEHSIKT